MLYRNADPRSQDKSSRNTQLPLTGIPICKEIAIKNIKYKEDELNKWPEENIVTWKEEFGSDPAFHNIVYLSSNHIVYVIKIHTISCSYIPREILFIPSHTKFNGSCC